jgi:hypothetical protein
MSDPVVLTLTPAPGGPTLRRARGEPPPMRRPRLDAYRLAKFAWYVLNDPALTEPRTRLVDDWRAYVRWQFRLTPAQDAALQAVGPEAAAAIARTVRRLVETGGELAARLPGDGSGGELVFTAYGDAKARGAKAKSTALTCTFDANCRNWSVR